jgi:hypothetical protein
LGSESTPNNGQLNGSAVYLLLSVKLYTLSPGLSWDISSVRSREGARVG